MYSKVEAMLNPEETEISFCLYLNALLLSAQQDALLLAETDLKRQKYLKLKDLVKKATVAINGRAFDSALQTHD
jgi:hypothetical protein